MANILFHFLSFIMLCVDCRHLAESYSLLHGTMAHPHKPCDALNDDFSDNNGITNGADWYSVQGGMMLYKSFIA